MGNLDWVQGSSELLQGKQFEIYKPNDNPLSILVPTKQKDSFVTNSNFSKPFSFKKIHLPSKWVSRGTQAPLHHSLP
jgi:hypothetical protein